MSKKSVKKKYSVQLIAYVEVEATITIEAKSESEAKSLAESMLEDNLCLRDIPSVEDLTSSVGDFEHINCEEEIWSCSPKAD